MTPEERAAHAVTREAVADAIRSALTERDREWRGAVLLARTGDTSRPMTQYADAIAPLEALLAAGPHKEEGRDG
jgi:hypothetical protein